MAFGLMGGDMQPQGHAQIITDLVDFGMGLQEAGDAIRFHHTGSTDPDGTVMVNGGVLHIEDGLSPEILEELLRRGHIMEPESVGAYGGYQAIWRDPKTGIYCGATEKPQRRLRAGVLTRTQMTAGTRNGGPMETNIEARMRRVERANRLLLGSVLALASLLFIGSKAQSDKVIRAQRFELVDTRGEVRAVLGTDGDGATGLFIHDPEGGTRLTLTHDPDQSALFIYDGEETVRVGVAQFSHGGGGVALHGAKSKGATVLYHKETGSLAIFDESGSVTTRIPDPDSTLDTE